MKLLRKTFQWLILDAYSKFEVFPKTNGLLPLLNVIFKSRKICYKSGLSVGC